MRVQGSRYNKRSIQPSQVGFALEGEKSLTLFASPPEQSIHAGIIQLVFGVLDLLLSQPHVQRVRIGFSSVLESCQLVNYLGCSLLLFAHAADDGSRFFEFFLHLSWAGVGLRGIEVGCYFLQRIQSAVDVGFDILKTLQTKFLSFLKLSQIFFDADLD